LTVQGEVFGWGNSEYSQFRMITEEQQLHTPTHIPLGQDRLGHDRGQGRVGSSQIMVGLRSGRVRLSFVWSDWIGSATKIGAALKFSVCKKKLIFNFSSNEFQNIQLKS